MSFILDKELDYDDDYKLSRSCSVGGKFLARERGAFITRVGGTEFERAGSTELDINDVRLDCVVKGIVSRGEYKKWKSLKSLPRKTIAKPSARPTRMPTTRS